MKLDNFDNLGPIRWSLKLVDQGGQVLRMFGDSKPYPSCPFSMEVEYARDDGPFLGHRRPLIEAPVARVIQMTLPNPENWTVKTAAALASEDDWTAKDGRSNSSDAYNAICKEVESIIRGDSFKLLNGQAGDTARLIVSNLAHRFNFGPQPREGKS